MEFLKVNCRLCKRLTNHDELFKKAIKEWFTYNFEEHTEYLVVQCRGCENISFLYRYWNSQMAYFNNDEDVYEDYWEETVYPNDMELRFHNNYLKQSLQYTPLELRNLYEQTVNNYRLGYYLFAVAGIRMIIEKLCMLLKIDEGFERNPQTGEIRIDKHGKQISRRSLEGKINGLFDNNYILFKDLPILHAIRMIGNEGLHETKTPSTNILTKALEVIEYVLVTIYEKKKFDELHTFKEEKEVKQ